MKQAEYYVKIYCDYEHIDKLNEEIAKEAPHTLGKLVDHAGEMPSRSGYCHDVLSGRIDRLLHVHKLFSRAKQLVESLNHDQRYCVVEWERNLGKLVKEGDNLRTLTTGKAVADKLGADYEWFKKTRQRGLDKINAALGILIA